RRQKLDVSARNRCPTLLADDSRDIARSRREKIVGSYERSYRATNNAYPGIDSFQPQIMSGFRSAHKRPLPISDLSGAQRQPRCKRAKGRGSGKRRVRRRRFMTKASAVWARNPASKGNYLRGSRKMSCFPTVSGDPYSKRPVRGYPLKSIDHTNLSACR